MEEMWAVGFPCKTVRIITCCLQEGPCRTEMLAPRYCSHVRSLSVEVAWKIMQYFANAWSDQPSRTFERISAIALRSNLFSRQVSRLRPQDSTVIIEVETGTGKELIGTAIHPRTSRLRRRSHESLISQEVCIRLGRVGRGIVAES